MWLCAWLGRWMFTGKAVVVVTYSRGDARVEQAGQYPDGPGRVQKR